MKRGLKIAIGGEWRLREAVEAQVRQEHETELKAATDHWQKAEIETKIAQEVRQRMKSLASPQSLWNAP